MNREIKYYNKEENQCNRLHFADGNHLKTGDIQVNLEKINFNDFNAYKSANIEFMRPGAVGKDIYHTYETLKKFIYNDKDYLNNDHEYLDCREKENSKTIKSDGRGTYSLTITNTKNDIINIIIKGIKHTEPAEVDVNMITKEQLSLYTGDKKNILIITQEELHRIFKIMESIEKDISKNPETFKALL
ncbi:MAG: hypothetical protein WC606_04655 [Candidatus Absconditabacterales bacterium]